MSEFCKVRDRLRNTARVDEDIKVCTRAYIWRNARWGSLCV